MVRLSGVEEGSEQRLAPLSLRRARFREGLCCCQVRARLVVGRWRARLSDVLYSVVEGLSVD